LQLKTNSFDFFAQKHPRLVKKIEIEIIRGFYNWENN